MVANVSSAADIRPVVRARTGLQTALPTSDLTHRSTRISTIIGLLPSTDDGGRRGGSGESQTSSHVLEQRSRVCHAAAVSAYESDSKHQWGALREGAPSSHLAEDH